MRNSANSGEDGLPDALDAGDKSVTAGDAHSDTGSAAVRKYVCRALRLIRVTRSSHVLRAP